MAEICASSFRLPLLLRSFFILPAQLTASTLIGQWPPEAEWDLARFLSWPDLHKYSSETCTESPAGISRLPCLRRRRWFQIQTRPTTSHLVMDGLSLPTVPSPLSTHIESKATVSQRNSSMSMSTQNSTCFFFPCSLPSLVHRSLFLER